MNAQYIRNVAKQAIGEKRLAEYVAKRNSKRIPPHIVRGTFLHDVKEFIINMTPETLGNICSFGHDFGKDGMIADDGPNSHYQIILSGVDSGMVLLQKIAVATILSTVHKMIEEGKPVGHRSTVLLQCDGVPGRILDGWADRDRKLRAVMGW